MTARTVGQISSEEAIGAVTITWSEEAIHGLGVRTDVPTAGSILGLSRTQAYEAVKAGRFPVPVIPVGRRLIVPVAPIRQLLGIGPPDKAALIDVLDGNADLPAREARKAGRAGLEPPGPPDPDRLLHLRGDPMSLSGGLA